MCKVIFILSSTFHLNQLKNVHLYKWDPCVKLTLKFIFYLRHIPQFLRNLGATILKYVQKTTCTKLKNWCCSSTICWICVGFLWARYRWEALNEWSLNSKVSDSWLFYICSNFFSTAQSENSSQSIGILH